MIIVDNALKVREQQGSPFGSAWLAPFHGAGAHEPDHSQCSGHAYGCRLQSASRASQHVYRYSGFDNIVMAGSQAQLDQAIRQGQPAVAEDPFMMCRSSEIDVIVDVTGSVEFGAHVILEAFKYGKPVVLMNAEVDATSRPDSPGICAQAQCDPFGLRGRRTRSADEPLPLGKGLGLIPRVIGNVRACKTPIATDNPAAWAERWGQTQRWLRLCRWFEDQF